MTHRVITSKETHQDCEHNFHVGDEVAVSQTETLPEWVEEFGVLMYVRADGLNQLLKPEDVELV